MANKIILDNLTGQDIKELIKDKKIDIEALDTSALGKLLDYETDMLCFGERDMNLIEQCSELLDKHNGGSIISEETFIEAINKAKAEIIAAEKETNKTNAIGKKRIILKRMLLIAAVIAILMTSTAIITTALGFDLLAYFREAVGLPVGSTIEYDNITVVNNGKITKYSSINELIEKEDLKIMYPSKFPDEIHITSVTVTDSVNGDKEIDIVTDDAHTYVAVFNNAHNINAAFDDCEMYERNGCAYYIRKDVNYAFCIHDSNYYSIQAQTYNELIFIIDNMME